MRWSTLSLAGSLLAAPLAAAEAGDQPRTAVIEALRGLWTELNEARMARDRAALDRIYADGFVWIHAAGYVNDESEHIETMLSAEPIEPIPMPAFEKLELLGDSVAILRTIGDRAAMGGRYVNTTVFVERLGRWQIASIQGTRLLPEPAAVTLDAGVLERYAGAYESDSGGRLTLVREGQTLWLVRTGFPRRLLTPTSATRFVDKLGAVLTFELGTGGEVEQFVIRLQSGVERRWRRLREP